MMGNAEQIQFPGFPTAVTEFPLPVIHLLIYLGNDLLTAGDK